MKLKRKLSVFLCLIMLLGVLFVPAYADDLNNESENLPDAVINVPSNTELYVGLKPANEYGSDKHYVPFTKISPTSKTDNGETSSYYFELEDNKTYNYRITSDNYITYAGTFKKTADFSMSITDEMLNTLDKDKTTVDRDISSNNGYNAGDIYLNINPQGYLKLNSGDTYQIVNLRNWEAVNDTISNYFIEPDYHYSVIDENGNETNCISIDENGLITANEAGTAIVLVTYDAMNLDYGIGKEFYGAIWQENTGVFVVSVDVQDSGIVTNMTLNEGKNNSDIKLSGDYIDAEHDVIYYFGEYGSYTFTPENENVSVSVNNPIIDSTVSYNGFEVVSENDDGSFTVPLKTGRNIVKLEKDAKAEYQIITAKKVNVTINNGNEVYPGDNLNIVFDTLYHPANKLAGVYNMSAYARYSNVSGYEGKIIGGLTKWYDFANSSEAQDVSNVLKEVTDNWGTTYYQKDTSLIVPDDYAYDTFTLSDGAIYVSGWGDPYGNHRNITYETGKDPNVYAELRNAYLCKLPDIKIPISVTSAQLESITLDTENVKTQYYVGDTFDTSGLVVTANYEDDKTQIATDYTVSPEILTKETQYVTITYRGKTATINVNVNTPKVVSIEVTNMPQKTSYVAGETFDPTGMVVTALLENGKKEEVLEYSYSPNRVLEETDTQITVTYSGENKAENVADVNVPISVTSLGGGSITSDTITVYFTLYGDDNHGTPTDSSNTHTMASKNLVMWLPKTAVKVNKGSYAIDVVSKALSIAGIPYVNNGNYISSIKGLKDFDNGNLSGWMYTINGIYPNNGIDEQIVKNGDSIVFHYTDDYTQERSAEIWTSNGSSLKPIKDDKKEVEKDEKDEKEENKQDDTEVNQHKFNDVNNHWANDAINYVYQKNLMKGTKEGIFEPESEMTRAMLVTVLYRLETPTKKAKLHSFKDVEEGQWYEEAVSWAVENGIVEGISETEFAPNKSITREQIALILYRYSQYKNLDTSVGEDTNILSYDDFEEISEYAISAMQWVAGRGLIAGETQSMLSPKKNATRAQVATIIMRFCEKIK